MDDASLRVTFDSSITPKNAERHLAAVAKNVEREKEKMFKALYKLALDAAESKVRVGRGNLRDSLRAGHRHSASFFSSKGFALGSTLPYARAQDNARLWGIKPAWPNVVSLRSWVAQTVRPTSKELDAVTFLIGRKLSTALPEPSNYLEYAASRVRIRMTSYSDKMAKNIKLKFR